MSTNDPDPLHPPSFQAPEYTSHLSTSPRNLSTSSQNPHYLSNSPQETRYSTSPLDTRHLSPDQRFSASPTAAELYTHGEPFPELSGHPPHVADPLIHIQQPSNEQDELSQMPASQPSSFAPFFTLISDSTVLGDDKDGNPKTPTTHHPSRIYYIFSDDQDSEDLKDACLRCLPDVSNSSNSNSLTNKDSGELRTANTSSRPGLSIRRSKDGKAKLREERVIIIDMNETGDRVVRAQSLSDKWQVMGCEIGKAPIWESAGEEGGENKEKEGGLMLRIDGVGIPILKEDKDLSRSREKGRGNQKDDDNGETEELDMDKILEGFDKQMNVLRTVIGGVGWDHGGQGVGNMDGEGDEGDVVIQGAESMAEGQKEREREGEAFEAS
ncbi:bbb4e9e1-b153-4d01-aac4-26afe03c7239 [Sclerotinia trifoliorum]|uniref:Bbb4e9e1-b153-4d01-aac4-26afe03c7239 n=1 Tax=Sclerotinia trifoliorum TaxID=28548 RepID=A0A8H2VYP3_9HELO|nr:bbb4e9e1-b153-4d01-aac4-26afe03c7239 [Sclerotinia trifoliorum]